MNTCEARNGTYSCIRPKGHPGDHVAKDIVHTDARNARVAVTRTSFADGYSPVKQRRLS